MTNDGDRRYAPGRKEDGTFVYTFVKAKAVKQPAVRNGRLHGSGH